MTAFDYDLFVIGAGSGGVRAGRVAAQTGARVAVAEEYRVGGTCVIRGCIPKKFMVYASEFSASFETARKYGWSVGEATFDWPLFREAMAKEVERLSGLYVSGLTNAGAEILRERAEIEGPHTVRLVGSGRTVTAERILIATGGRPSVPADLPGVEHALVSDDVFHLPELPKRILVVGGGYIAVEFAGVFNGLGVETTQLYRGPRLLRGFDEDVRAHVTDEVARRGVNLVLDAHHVAIEKTSTGLVSRLNTGATIETDVILFATGRDPYTAGLGLERAGVATNAKGAVVVDHYSRTSVPSIWAVGDVTDRINLTPVAIREGQAFAETEFKAQPSAFDHEMVASAVFSQPPVGSVGMSEAEARAAGHPVEIYRSSFRPQKVTLYSGQEKVLMKLVVDKASHRILGCHVVGSDGPEIIQMAAIALKMGITKEAWDSTCAVHPTAAEELVTMREPVAG